MICYHKGREQNLRVCSIQALTLYLIFVSTYISVTDGFFHRGPFDTFSILPYTFERKNILQHTITALSLNYDENIDKDIDFTRQLQNQDALSASLGDLFRKSAPVTKNNDQYINSQRNREQLEQIETDLRVQESEQMNLQEEQEIEGVYLDPNEYAAYSESLPFLSTRPSSSKSSTFDSFATSTKTIYDLNSIPNSLYQNRIPQNSDATNIDPDDIYRQVFENEQGYLNQTAEFKFGLFDSESESEKNDNESDGIEVYLSKKRAEANMSKQKEAMAIIDREIEEFENKMKAKQALEVASGSNHNSNSSNGAQPELQRCVKCGSKLSKFDLENYNTCHICHAEQFRFASGISVTRGESHYKQEKDDDTQLGEKQNERKSRRMQGMQPKQNQSFISPKTHARNSSQRYIPRSQRQNIERQTSEQILNHSTSNNQNQLENVQRLESDLQQYKSLYEETKKELENLRMTVTELKSQISSSSEKTEESPDNTATSQPTEKKQLEHPWVEVLDKDTGNIFIWNKETGETKWKSEL